MPRLLNPRCVLSVRDLKVSTEYYLAVFRFEREPIEAKGWSFLSRGAEIFLQLADRPWKMREFGVRTIDGHRIVFGQRIGAKID